MEIACLIVVYWQQQLIIEIIFNKCLWVLILNDYFSASKVELEGENISAVEKEIRRLSAMLKIVIEQNNYGAFEYFQANPQKAKDLYGTARLLLTHHYLEELEKFKESYQVLDSQKGVLDSHLHDAIRGRKTLRLEDPSNTKESLDINPPQ